MTGRSPKSQQYFTVFLFEARNRTKYKRKIFIVYDVCMYVGLRLYLLCGIGTLSAFHRREMKVVIAQKIE